MAETIRDLLIRVIGSRSMESADGDAAVADDILGTLTAARLAVVPVPEGTDAVIAAMMEKHAACRYALPNSAVTTIQHHDMAAVVRSVAPIIAAAEREAYAEFVQQNGGYMDPDDLAAAIRAGGRRGE